MLSPVASYFLLVHRCTWKSTSTYQYMLRRVIIYTYLWKPKKHEPQKESKRTRIHRPWDSKLRRSANHGQKYRVGDPINRKNHSLPELFEPAIQHVPKHRAPFITAPSFPLFSIAANPHTPGVYLHILLLQSMYSDAIDSTVAKRYRVFELYVAALWQCR